MNEGTRLILYIAEQNHYLFRLNKLKDEIKTLETMISNCDVKITRQKKLIAAMSPERDASNVG